MKNILNIAVIGASKMAMKHMDGVIANKKAKLYAVCDKYIDKAKAAAEKYGVDVYTDDYKTLVNDPEVDAVVIVTPDQVHLEQTSAFLRAGKDVLCEKPMALNLDECDKMRDVEKETGRMLMIGQVCRCTPAFIAAKKLVDEGAIGDLFFVESEYAHCYEKTEGVDAWRKTPERHGFIGGGCHAVDLLRWIAGNPTEVTAYGNHKCLTEWPTDDCVIAIYKFPNNVIGKVFTSIGCRRNYTMRTVLYGTKGTIICDNTSPSFQLFKNGPDLENGKGAYTVAEEIPVDINNHNVTLEIEDFINALQSGKPAPVSSMEGASTIAVCTATVASVNDGETKTIVYPR